ncbi:hypothetical protein ACFL5F_06470 [Planctomycetota bacterium]
MDGVVKDLALENVVIRGGVHVSSVAAYSYFGSIANCSTRGSVAGIEYVGGIVGENSGLLSCSFYIGTVTGTKRYIGGLVGVNGSCYNWGAAINNCYSIADINTEADCVGDLVGVLYYSSLTNCYSQGFVVGKNTVGGLVGNTLGTASMANCYSVADVYGEDRVGVLLGHLTSDSAITNCFWASDRQNGNGIDGIGVNDGQATKVYSLMASELKLQDTFTDAGWDFAGESTNGTSETWQMSDHEGYPVLSFFNREVPFPLPGNGTLNDPFVISSAEELGMINWYTIDSYFELTDDIDLSSIAWSTPVVPVFDGRFDGNGHIIRNLDISGASFLGFFGCQGKGSNISHVSVIDGAVSGSSFIGGLLGNSSYGKVTNCSFSGNISAIGRFVGGLVGRNQGHIRKSYSVGTVKGIDMVGGLVGSVAFGAVSNSFSTSAVTCSGSNAGGLVADNGKGSITNCYAAGSVHGSGYVGGLIGNNMGTTTHCYSACVVSGDGKVVGLVGLYFGTVIGCYWDSDKSAVQYSPAGIRSTTLDMMKKQTYLGWDDGSWIMHDGHDYPRLAWESLGPEYVLINTDYPERTYAGNGITTAFQLRSSEDLVCMSLRSTDWDKNFMLLSDIDMASVPDYYPPTSFSGQIDGAGNRIVNLQIDPNNIGILNRLGLIGTLESTGIVQDLHLDSVIIAGNTNSNYLGAIVGYNSGTIHGCSSHGRISGLSYIGGLVGNNSYGGCIINCCATGEYEGNSGVGGIAGYNMETIAQCYSSSIVTAHIGSGGGLVGTNSFGSIANCYSFGYVFSSENAGGLVGMNSNSSVIRNCYSVCDVSCLLGGGTLLGQSYSGSSIDNCFWDRDVQTGGISIGVGLANGHQNNVAGLTTSEMQTASTFLDAGWDFVEEADNGTDDIWWIDEGQDYPRLWWELISEN